MKRLVGAGTAGAAALGCGIALLATSGWSFAGPAFHTAEWRHDIDLAGRRVAVVGTGCSAIQVVPAIQPLAGHLPRQAIHADLTDDNLVCTLQHGLRVPDGVIDFGDLTTSWAVGELATAVTSLLRHAVLSAVPYRRRR